jgi:CBS domain-containing membrane protein
MADPVITLGRNDQLSLANNLLKQERIRHIPVVDDDGRLCGIVTQRDLFRGALLRALGYGSRIADKMYESLPVKEAMTSEVLTTSPETPARDAAHVMLENKVGCLPVVVEGKLVGIITEADFVKVAVQSDEEG